MMWFLLTMLSAVSPAVECYGRAPTLVRPRSDMDVTFFADGYQIDFPPSSIAWMKSCGSVDDVNHCRIDARCGIIATKLLDTKSWPFVVPKGFHVCATIHHSSRFSGRRNSDAETALFEAELRLVSLETGVKSSHYSYREAGDIAEFKNVFDSDDNDLDDVYGRWQDPASGVAWTFCTTEAADDSFGYLSIGYPFDGVLTTYNSINVKIKREF